MNRVMLKMTNRAEPIKWWVIISHQDISTRTELHHHQPTWLHPIQELCKPCLCRHHCQQMSSCTEPRLQDPRCGLLLPLCHPFSDFPPWLQDQQLMEELQT